MKQLKRENEKMQQLKRENEEMNEKMIRMNEMWNENKGTRKYYWCVNPEKMIEYIKNNDGNLNIGQWQCVEEVVEKYPVACYNDDLNFPLKLRQILDKNLKKYLGK